MSSGHIYRPMTTRYIGADGRQVSKDTPGARKQKIRGKTYRAKYVEDGRRKTCSLNTTDSDEAQLALAKLIERLKLKTLDPFSEHRDRPIAEHLAEYLRHLDNRNKSEKHLAKVTGYLSRIVDGCGVQTVADFDADRVERYLSDRRRPQSAFRVSLKQIAAILKTAGVDLSGRKLKQWLPSPSLPARQGQAALWEWRDIRDRLNKRFSSTLPRACPLPDALGISDFAFNDHIAAVKAFANWLVRTDRIQRSPFQILRKLNVEEAALRHERRAASLDDFEKLLTPR